MQVESKVLPNDWNILLRDEINKPYFIKLLNDVEEEYSEFTCYPPKEQIFNAFCLTPYKDVKVLILGQDPYHNENQAMGLAFSVNKNVKLPPSLINIYKELESDLNVKNDTGDLSSWAKSGVLLLNAILSVRQNQPLSHHNLGWERFTDKVIEALNKKKDPIVFVLWGSYARSKKKLITDNKHFIIENVHPSPLSAYRGFFGSKPFSKINAFLNLTNQQMIDFKISR
ncbi:MAG: uracil-DNA glycosylase [Candidatus Izemoplasmatales bacterium]|nr:uracil-DNA glycosylase [Candidatus Izemoplasmatales bacterium]